ncbi:hypothetical protein [Priestia endophytica]|uniref:hypothetical protein n=1 Tax=Priestia endophytica TaxID=135735 RepID=UPI00227FADD7|nr:hypothetical protein [Priestia endophytica]MCY8235276.1 hypothetical protein [Priestia endophytica]
MSVDIQNTEFEIENYKVYVGPSRMIDPSSGYALFMCEPKEGNETKFLGILKTKKGDIIYPEVDEHHAGLINALMRKANQILDSSEAVHNTELDSDTLLSETIKFVEQDLYPTNDEDTVMSFDFGGFLNSVGNTVKSGFDTVKHGLEEVGKGIVNVGDKVITAGKVAIDLGLSMADRDGFHRHMHDTAEDLEKLGLMNKKEE